jgi:hypothetical protein
MLQQKVPGLVVIVKENGLRFSNLPDLLDFCVTGLPLDVELGLCGTLRFAMPVHGSARRRMIRNDANAME